MSGKSSSVSAFCCSRPEERVDSPEPPSRVTGSGICRTIDGVFATAPAEQEKHGDGTADSRAEDNPQHDENSAPGEHPTSTATSIPSSNSASTTSIAAVLLPEDHPHAPRSLKHRRSNVETGFILSSPGVLGRVKAGLGFQKGRSKKIKGLRKEAWYDGDAALMGSVDIVGRIGEDDEEDLKGDMVAGKESGIGLGSDETSQRPNDLRVSVDLASVDDQLRIEITPASPNLQSPVLKSFSTPNLLTYIADDVLDNAARRQPTTGFGSTLNIPRSRPRSGTVTGLCEIFPEFIAGAFGDNELRVQEKEMFDSGDDDGNFQEEDDDDDETVVPISQMDGEEDHPRCGNNPSNLTMESPAKALTPEVPHLHTMDIHAQLRSMSQLSGSDFDRESLEPSAQQATWTFHRRERSNMGELTSLSHSRAGSTTVDRATIPATWGRVQSPASSSMYSRPTSTVHTRGLSSLCEPFGEIEGPLGEDQEWPLASTPIIRGLDGTRDEDQNVVNLNLDGPQNDSDDLYFSHLTTSSLHTTKISMKEEPSVSFLMPPPGIRTSSISGLSSSSTATKASKTTRFFEHFSPPKKLIKKRQSVFRFFRPSGSRIKNPGRSISSPILISTTQSGLFQKSPGAFDGPADETRRGTIHHELSTYLTPTRPSRSASMNYLGPYQAESAAAHSLETPSVGLQRRPSMLEYEYNLSITGDDRRRPSNANLNFNLEVVGESQATPQDDRKDPNHFKRRLMRATPLEETRSSSRDIMVQALAKHQDEKALFRSASKARESLSHVHSSEIPTLNSSLFVPGPSTPVSSASARRPTEVFDPLDSTGLESAAASHLSVANARSTHLLTSGVANTNSTNEGLLKQRASSVAVTSTSSSHLLSDARPRRTKIGTSLVSWSRYPSHTRVGRSASAGRADDVIARDFAVGEQHGGETQIGPGTHGAPYSLLPGQSSTAIGDTTTSKSPKQKRHRLSLPKSPSTFSSSVGSNGGGFAGFLHYYSNIFAYGSSQNRRSSVATGGWLEHPDLEMLAPVHAGDWEHGGHRAQHHHHHLLSQQFRDFEELLREDLERVEAGASKLIRHQNAAAHGQHQEAHQVHGLGDGKDMDETTNVAESVFGRASPFQEGHWHLEHQPSMAVGPDEDVGEDPLMNTSYFSNNKIAGGKSEVSVSHGRSRHEQDILLEQEDLAGPDSAEDLDPAIDSLEHARLYDGAADERCGSLLSAARDKEAQPRTPKDATGCSSTKSKESPLSRAEFWSGVYKSCIEQDPSIRKRSQLTQPGHELLIPKSTSPSHPTSPVSQLPQDLTTAAPAFLPPSNPVNGTIDPKAPCIRRFPSVTVVDDLKGHSRSVSLISVRANSISRGSVKYFGAGYPGSVSSLGSCGGVPVGSGIMRTSTNDLLLLIQKKEVEEREKLLGVRSGLS